jgi:hypothetical protein
MAGDFLCELYSLRHEVGAICQRYFDGHQVPFPAVAQEFARLIGSVRELVVGYNEDFANESSPETGPAPECLPAVERSAFIDTATLEVAVVPAARHLHTFLVNIARAEALDSMGDNREAVTLIDRYVQANSTPLDWAPQHNGSTGTR